MMKALALAFALAPTVAIAAPVTAGSPDGTIRVTVDTDNDGRVVYSIARNGTAIVAPSKMGFLLADAMPLVRGFTIAGSRNGRADTQWTQPWGERRVVRDRHNELAVDLVQSGEPDRRRLTVRFRVFDDGVGFRYEFPDQPTLKTVRIADEVTEFAIAQPGTAWWIPGGAWNRYEYLYQKTPIAGVATAHTPMTMRLNDGTHLSIHEAALVDYSGMWVKREEEQLFRSTLSPGLGGAAARVVRSAPFSTPWRTIRIAADAPALYDNDLELNLNEPNKLGDVSWVKPHRYIGIWWGMHLDRDSWATGPRHGATTARARQYIDFAAKHGFRGVLIEGWNKGWDGNWFGHGDAFSFTEATPDFDLQGVAAYARAKGVRIVGHHETGGNIDVYERQLEPAMALYARLGIDAVKTGYVADAGGIIAPGGQMAWHDGQRQVQHHLKVVETAARYRIAINPHEPVKDTGLRRTYPNWVAREGARGMEYNAWGAPDNPAAHEALLYFTRMLSGPMDFTPGVLSLTGKAGQPMNSTLAKQLALYLVLYSPIQMAADLPENLAKYPRELAFISTVPVDWRATRTLSGAVGEHVVVARADAQSDDWYVGGVTDEQARDVTVDLSFLPEGRRYLATIYRDGATAAARSATRHDIVIEDRRVTRADRLPVRMAPGGGFAIRLKAVR